MWTKLNSDYGVAIVHKRDRFNRLKAINIQYYDYLPINNNIIVGKETETS